MNLNKYSALKRIPAGSGPKCHLDHLEPEICSQAHGASGGCNYACLVLVLPRDVDSNFKLRVLPPHRVWTFCDSHFVSVIFVY
jgi:hypothetical protein